MKRPLFNSLFSATGVVLTTLFLFAPLSAHCQPKAASISLPVVGKLPAQIMMHGSAVVGSRLYIFGGSKQGEGWTADVWSCTITGEGQLGEWRSEAPLPEMRAYLGNGVEVIEDRIYVLHGLVGKTKDAAGDQMDRARTVLWARVESDGRITRWNTAPLPEEAPHSSAVASNGKNLVITGGRVEGKLMSMVYVSELNFDGTPKEWKVKAIMPTPRWFHNATFTGGRLYVWGGLTTTDRSKVENSVYSAVLGLDGTIGPWRQESNMPQPVFSSTAGGFANLLVSVGGRYTGSYPTNVIWTARIVNSLVSEWVMIRSDLKARIFHSIALDRERGLVFISGGSSRSTPEAAIGNRLDVVQAVRVSD